METLRARHFKFGDFEIDAAKRLLLKDGQTVALNSKTFDVLLTLVESHGQVLGREEIFDRVWPGQFVEEANLTVQISALRKIFGENKNDHRFIVTVPGRGYSFVADVDDARLEEVVVETHRFASVVVEQRVTDSDASSVDHSQLATLSETRTSVHRGFSYLAAASVALALGLGYWFFVKSSPGNDHIDSIAVMPFVSESENPDVDFLADGLTESLINNLSALPGLSVKARSSVFSFKGKDASPKTVGEELNVRAVLLGRAVERAGQVTVYVSLVDTQSGDQIWGDRFERSAKDVITLQTAIAHGVSRKLREKISMADEQKIAKNFTNNPEAYLLYLKGRHYWNKRSAKDLVKAIEFFEQATQADSNYALAFAGLADAYSLLSNYGGSSAHETKPKAMTAALKALSLDNDLAEAHTSLGGILGDYHFDFAGEEREYKRAIELNPNYSTAHHWYAEMMARNGRFDESELEFRRALEIDPLSLPIARNYADTLYFAGKYEASAAELNKLVELDPSFFHVYEGLAALNQTLGNYAGCVEGFAKIEESIGEPRFAEQMRNSYARGGWQSFLREMTGAQKPTNLPSYLVAVFSTAHGDKDGAFEHLYSSLQKREGFILWIKVDPRLDPLRDDPRFNELLKEVGYAAS